MRRHLTAKSQVRIQPVLVMGSSIDCRLNCTSRFGGVTAIAEAAVLSEILDVVKGVSAASSEAARPGDRIPRACR